VDGFFGRPFTFAIGVAPNKQRRLSGETIQYRTNKSEPFSGGITLAARVVGAVRGCLRAAAAFLEGGDAFLEGEAFFAGAFF